MSNQRYKSLVRHYSLSIFIGLSVLFLLGSAVFLLNKFLSVKTQVEASQLEVSDLQQKINEATSNTIINVSDIDSYKNILSQLIPESEDTFSILYALEKISIDTEFGIARYTITPLAGSEKITLSIKGRGNPDAFLKFVNGYSFSGGRYVASEVVDYDSTKEETAFTLSFYAKKANDAATQTNLLVPSDVAFLNKVREKTSIVVNSGATVSDYPVAVDPFNESTQPVPEPTVQP